MLLRKALGFSHSRKTSASVVRDDMRKRLLDILRPVRSKNYLVVVGEKSTAICKAIMSLDYPNDCVYVSVP